MEKQGIAIYDAAEYVRRLHNNAADKYLEIVKITDLNILLAALPVCEHIITTGEKATQLVLDYYKQSNAAVEIGSSISLKVDDDRCIRLHRLPSSSRAYPIALSTKAELYQPCFSKIFNIKN